MRKISIVLFVMILFCGGTFNVFAGEGSILKVSKEPWGFGKIVKGEIKEKTFAVENAGKDDLIIEKIKACCGYTVADVDSWTIKPGAVAQIKIISDTSRKSIGEDEKYITIFSNDSIVPEKKIAVTSEIIRDNNAQKVRVPGISVDKLNKYIQEGKNIIILDVREESEFTEKHIPGAVNYPRSRMKYLDQALEEIVQGVDKDTIISVNCGAGVRSSYIARKLKDRGYNAYNLEGGIKAWVDGGFDIIVGPKTPRTMMPLEIGLEEAFDHYFVMFKDNVIWVDVRESDDFQKGHIQGARNIEIYDLKDELSALSKTKEIVLYCYGPECGESEAAGKLLIENGFKQGKTKVLVDGYRGWEEAGYPVEK